MVAAARATEATEATQTTDNRQQTTDDRQQTTDMYDEIQIKFPWYEKIRYEM